MNWSERSGHLAEDGMRGGAALFERFVFICAIAFVFTVPWENAVRISGFGTISRAVGIPLIGAWLLLMFRAGRVRRLHAFHIGIMSFVFWCALTLLWSANLDLTVQQSKTFVQLLASLLIIWTVVDTPDRSRGLLQAFVLGATVTAVLVIYNHSMGNVTRWSQRASIEGVDENDIALVMAIALPAAWYLATGGRPGFGRYHLGVLNFVYIPLGLIAIIMTGSRGGFASTIPFYLYVIYSTGMQRFRTKLALMLAVTVVAALVVSNAPEGPLKRITTTFDEIDSGNISGRADIWLQGLEVWLQNDFFSIVGIGSGGYIWTIGRVAHSTPISVLVETGVIGLSILALCLLLLFRAALRSEPAERAVCVAMLFIWLIGITALSWEYRKPTWILWSTIVCVSASHRRETPDERFLVTPTPDRT